LAIYLSQNSPTDSAEEAEKEISGILTDSQRQKIASLQAEAKAKAASKKQPAKPAAPNAAAAK
jgi:hypothetical protein